MKTSEVPPTLFPLANSLHEFHLPKDNTILFGQKGKNNEVFLVGFLLLSFNQKFKLSRICGLEA